MNKLSQSVGHRIYSIDFLRGLVMVIMALDHVRDFFHSDAMQRDPLDLNTTTPLLFFTRWITHFCAPVFVFLSGASASLMGLRKSKSELRVFLIKRGLWLILIEITVVTLAISFNPFYNLIFLQVIWAIGISMVILGLLLPLPYPAILLIGLCIVLGHNFLDFPELARNRKLDFWWGFIHGPFGIYPFAKNHAIAVIYSFLPWTGIMILGYCLGKVFYPITNELKRRKLLLSLGFGLVCFFIILRIINIYGNPFHWFPQRNFLYSFLSFINVSKYPPSLQYICLTLGPALIFLGLTQSLANKFSTFFMIYGRVPFFYYILHFYLIHLLTLIAFFLSGYGIKDIGSPGSMFLFRPPHFGFPLWSVYLIWIGVVAVMFPLCKWYGNYKTTHKQWWLSYL